jgi:hypothetical protein
MADFSKYVKNVRAGIEGEGVAKNVDKPSLLWRNVYLDPAVQTKINDQSCRQIGTFLAFTAKLPYLCRELIFDHVDDTTAIWAVLVHADRDYRSELPDSLVSRLLARLNKEEIMRSYDPAAHDTQYRRPMEPNSNSFRNHLDSYYYKEYPYINRNGENDALIHENYRGYHNKKRYKDRFDFFEFNYKRLDESILCCHLFFETVSMSNNLEGKGVEVDFRGLKFFRNDLLLAFFFAKYFVISSPCCVTSDARNFPDMIPAANVTISTDLVDFKDVFVGKFVFDLDYLNEACIGWIIGVNKKRRKKLTKLRKSERHVRLFKLRNIVVTTSVNSIYFQFDDDQGTVHCQTESSFGHFTKHLGRVRQPIKDWGGDWKQTIHLRNHMLKYRHNDFISNCFAIVRDLYLDNKLDYIVNMLSYSDRLTF